MDTAAEADRAARRAQVVETLCDAVATIDHAPPVHVAVDGTGGGARGLADDLGRVLAGRGRRCRRVSLDGLGFLDPVVADRLGREVFLAETRAFFAPRAATWEERFGDDDPAYAAAVAELGLRAGQTTLDAGCGTGRALPHLRAAVGPGGRVLGFDLIPEMLAAARGHGRHTHALLALADARRLPLPTSSVDGVFAAGLLPHLPDPGSGLADLARVVRPGGRLVLFHPSGRAALAARHGRRPRDDDLLAHAPLARLLQWTGWSLDRYDDGPHRFLACGHAVRRV